MFLYILNYAYDMDECESYASIIRQFGHLNKRFKHFTRKRDFLEMFYYTMFPKVVIPTDSVHIKGISCNTRRRMDTYGYNYYTTWDNRIVKYGRCKIPSHYETFKERNKKSRFKDLYLRCRDKFINVMLKKNPHSRYMEERLRFKKRHLDFLQREYDDMERKRAKHYKYYQLKTEFNPKK